ncbi:hypothetical protein BH09BAC2_BH09BAC2_13900 [soil metagenome]
MKYIYTAYTKVINNVTFYFVKKYLTFPQYKNVRDMLEGFGMHTTFEGACNIAKLEDENIKLQLLNQIQEPPSATKVIQMNNEPLSKAL